LNPPNTQSIETLIFRLSECNELRIISFTAELFEQLADNGAIFPLAPLSRQNPIALSHFLSIQPTGC